MIEEIKTILGPNYKEWIEDGLEQQEVCRIFNEMMELYEKYFVQGKDKEKEGKI